VPEDVLVKMLAGDGIMVTYRQRIRNALKVLESEPLAVAS
jgi:hypothetical protein